DGQIQNFLVSFYPIIRDFPQWLQMLLDRSPPMGREFFTDNIRVERRHDAMWRAMGDGFNVPKKRFQEPEPMLAEVKKFHGYLTDMCRNAEFGEAVSATNYAVEGVAQKISEKALRGLAKNAKIGPRGRWWLEEHAKYDDEHPIHALEIIKDCVKRGPDSPQAVTDSALESLDLMRHALPPSASAVGGSRPLPRALAHRVVSRPLPAPEPRRAHPRGHFSAGLSGAPRRRFHRG